MENISYDALEKIGYKGYLLPKDAPEKVLQFGEGNFLRAFVDRFFDMGNEATGWNGKVVMVQPINGAFGFADGVPPPRLRFSASIRSTTFSPRGRGVAAVMTAPSRLRLISSTSASS